MSEEIERRREAFRAWVDDHDGVAGVARRANLTGSTIYSYLDGKANNPNLDTITKIATAFDVSIEELFGGRRRLPREVPIVGYVAADPSGQSLLFRDAQGPFGTAEPPQGATQTTVAAEIRGQSLGPVFDGGLVFYNDVRSPVTTDLFNRLCVVGLPDGRVLVKLLKPAAEGLFHLISNGGEQPMFSETVDWAARVIDVRPR